MVPKIFVHVKRYFLPRIGIEACPTVANRPSLYGDAELPRICDFENKISSQTFPE